MQSTAIGYNMRSSINQSNVDRLHKRVDKNNFKNAALLSTSDTLTILWRGGFGFTRHFLPRLPTVYRRFHRNRFQTLGLIFKLPPIERIARYNPHIEMELSSEILTSVQRFRADVTCTRLRFHT
jgi:hypothetical protein